jgi:glycosyltransferase involved in cell wall biosynthesis
VRAYHQLRILGRRHRVTLLSFASRAERALGPGPLAECSRVVMVPLSLPQAAAALLRRGLSSHPLQVAIHESRLMRRAIRRARETETFDVAHVQLVRMAPYLDDIGPLPHVVDLVDALSLNMERRARHDRGVGRWLARLEGRRLGRYERTVCDAVDRALVGSATDRQALGSPPKLAVVTSGVDLTEFPRQHGGREPATVIFAGNMGYFPNVLAARWLGGTILPTVARDVPGVRLRIVGARPDPEVLSMARRDARITVVAGPEHIAPHLGRAAVAVAPMQAGSGQQLKVLEAMASGTPVVATTIAAGGVEARHGEHLLVADEPEAFAAHVVRLLTEPMLAAGLADRARGLVESRYTWDRSVAELERIYESVIDEHDNR